MAIGMARRSSMTLVGFINLLQNATINDMTYEQKIEFESQLKYLTTDEVTAQITLLLDEKNREIQDAASLNILSAFHDGNFIVESELVPISNYTIKEIKSYIEEIRGG